MIDEKTWKEFRDTGLLWWINRTLHLFGWVIVGEMTGKNIDRVYPARTKFRGFTDNIEEDGFKQVTEYLGRNIDELIEEVNE